MECPNCGHRGTEGAKYCDQCGTALASGTGAEVVTTGVAMPSPRVTEPPVGESGRPGEESRYWAIGAHLSALIGGFLGGVPAFLGPVVVWLVRKNVDPYAAIHGRNALNFNLSVLVYAVVLIVLTIISFGLGALLTLPAGIALAVGWLVFSIIGMVKAANNQVYRYPLTIPFVR